MRQTLHILAKDIKRQRIDIVLLLAILLVFVFVIRRSATHLADSGAVEMLFVAAAVLVIARAVHAEPIPGDRQFWLTRPYRWRELLQAKLLFILLVVQLPLALAQLFIVAGAGLPILPALPGLFCSQLLFFVCISLPAIVVALITPGLVAFLFAAIALVVLEWSQSQLLVPSVGFLYPIEWLRAGVQFALVVLLAVAVSYVQYRYRRTFLSRLMATGVVLACIAIFSFLPWQYAYALQSRLSKQPFDPSSIHVGLTRLPFSPYMFGRPGQITVEFPVSVTGLPRDTELVVDAVTVSVAGSGASNRHSELPDAQVTRDRGKDGGIVLHLTTVIDDGLFNGHDTITAHISLFATAFGGAKSRTIPVQLKPVNVLEGIQCFAAARPQSSAPLATDVVCRSAFRWPALLVDAFTPNTGVPSSISSVVSYSPFPATFAINPLEYRWTAISSSDTVTIRTMEPLAHFRRDLVIPGIRQADFNPWRYESPRR